MPKKTNSPARPRSQTKLRQDLAIAITRADHLRGGYLSPAAIATRADSIAKAMQKSRPSPKAR